MSRDRRLLTVTILASQASMGVVSLLPPVFAGWLEGYFHIQKTQLGLLFTVGGVGGAVAGLVAGWLADRFGHRRILAASLACMGAGYVACGLVCSYLPFLAASLLAGLGAGGFAAVGAAVLCAAYPTQTRRLMGLFQLAAAIGFCGSPLLLNVLLGIARSRPAEGWSAPFHVPFIAGGAVLWVAALLVSRTASREVPSPTHAEAAPDLPPPLSARPRLAAAVVILLAALHAGEAAMSYWFVRYCEVRFAHPLFPPAWGLSAYGAAFIVGRTVLSTVGDRAGNYRWLIVPGLLGGSLYLGVPLAPSQALATAALVCAGLLISMEYPALFSLAARVWPGRGATLMGAAGLSNLAATVLYSTLLGAAADHGVPLATVMVLPGCSILTFGLTAALWALSERRHARAAA
jgi:MFS family permease